MILRGTVCCIFWGLSFSILLGQQASVYSKPDIQLESNWKEYHLYQAIFAHFPILEETGSDLLLKYDISSPGGRHLTYAQTFQEKEIHEAGIKVNLDHNGKVYSFLSTLTDFSILPASLDKSTLPNSHMIAYAQQLTNAYEIQLEEKWIVQDQLLMPVTKAITFSHEEVVSYELLIHAVSGSLIRQEDRGAYYDMPPDTSGWTRLFKPDPCTKAQVHYGDLFTDAGDMHVPAFDLLMDTVELKELTFDNGMFHLLGPHVHIQDRAPFNVPPATSPNGEFFYTRDQSEFEDVMVYYHIDTFQRYVQSLGFTNLENRPFKADPHGKSDLDQSVFVINGADSYILFGDGGVDDAEDADVIIHEYGHALSNAAAPETRSGTERKGLDEGIGDYFASAYSYDLSSWGWHEVFIWDGHNEFWPGRMVVNTLSYPPPSGSSIYVYGELWAATMMQIRNQIGAQVTDQLQLEELYANFVGMSLTDAAQLVLDADSMLFEGAHSETIYEYFCQRNFFEQSSCLPVGIEKELETEIELFPNPSTGLLRLSMPERIDSDTWILRVSDMNGRELWKQSLSNSRQQEIHLNLPAGIYLLSFFDAEGLVGSKKLLISKE